MKIMKYIMPLLLIACMFASCDTDVENATVVAPTTYGPQYYKNLRDYKKSDHSIAWGWFADYTQSTSLATRFLGLPDSLDICSLWGGIPSDDSTHVDTHYLPEVYREMKYVQEVKGTRLVVPSIIRIRTRPEFYDSIWVKQNDPQAAMRAYAQDLLRPIFENGLDGIDMDYEPEGDPLTGSNLDYFVEYVGQFVGPMASPDSTFTYPTDLPSRATPTCCSALTTTIVPPAPIPISLPTGMSTRPMAEAPVACPSVAVLPKRWSIPRTWVTTGRMLSADSCSIMPAISPALAARVVLVPSSCTATISTLAMDAATTPTCATASKSRTPLSTKTVISNSIKI